MPTDRFYRLPKEKVEAIRKAALKEFMRAAPEEASINKIIRDADISRGSFYTYFENKYELLKWLFNDKIAEYWKFYEETLIENNGDVWDMFRKSLDMSIRGITADGFLGIIQKLLESSIFSEMFKEGLDNEREEEVFHSRQQYLDRMYELVDKEKCPVDRAGFFDLMELHGIMLMMAIKLLLRDQRPMEEVREVYNRRIRLLKYGAMTQNQLQENEERQDEKRHE